MSDCIRAGHVNCWYTDGKLVLAVCDNCKAYKSDKPDALRFPDLSKAVRLDFHPNPPIGNPAFEVFGIAVDTSIRSIAKWQEVSGCQTPEELSLKLRGMHV